MLSVNGVTDGAVLIRLALLQNTMVDPVFRVSVLSELPIVDTENHCE